MTAVNCPFCRIVAGDLPAQVLYQDDLVTAFRDMHPVAPTHVLIVPNRHIPSITHLEENDQILMGRLLIVAKKIAQQENITETGFRSLINTGIHAGQTVPHLHLHIIGGKPLHLPLG